MTFMVPFLSGRSTRCPGSGGCSLTERISAGGGGEQNSLRESAGPGDDLPARRSVLLRSIPRGATVVVEEVGEHRPVHGNEAVVRIDPPAALVAIGCPRVIEFDHPDAILLVDTRDGVQVGLLAHRPA